jgi:hypothetical protein
VEVLQGLASLHDLPLRTILQILEHRVVSRMFLERLAGEQIALKIQKEFDLPPAAIHRLVHLLQADPEELLPSLLSERTLAMLGQIRATLEEGRPGLEVQLCPHLLTGLESAGLMLQGRLCTLVETLRPFRMLLIEVDPIAWLRVWPLPAPLEGLTVLYPAISLDVLVYTRADRKEMLAFCARLWELGIRAEWCRGVPLKTTPKLGILVEIRKSKKKKFRVYEGSA